MNGRLIPAIVVCLAWGAPASAQRLTNLYGRVLDPSEAAVAGASITVVSEDTGFRRFAESQPDGEYAVGSLQPGVYKITVRKEGFRTMVRFNVRLEAAQAARVDFLLSMGAIEETITVEGTAPLLSPDEASTETRVFHDEIERLPLNGRGLLALLELSPGANVTPATRGEAGQFTANGQRPNANYFTVDGMSANTGVSAGGLPAQASGGVLPAMSAFGSLDSLMPLEAVEEFRVQTSNAAPDVSRLPGAVVSLTSRSGSNEFHGSAVFRFRHELLAANDWFANDAGQGRAPLRMEDVSPSLRRSHTPRPHFLLSGLRAAGVARAVRVAATGAVAGRAAGRLGLGSAGAQPVSRAQRRRPGQWTGAMERPQHPAIQPAFGTGAHGPGHHFPRHVFRAV
jgi:hypothetical protein